MRCPNITDLRPAAGFPRYNRTFCICGVMVSASDILGCVCGGCHVMAAMGFRGTADIMRDVVMGFGCKSNRLASRNCELAFSNIAFYGSGLDKHGFYVLLALWAGLVLWAGFQRSRKILISRCIEFLKSSFRVHLTQAWHTVAKLCQNFQDVMWLLVYSGPVGVNLWWLSGELNMYDNVCVFSAEASSQMINDHCLGALFENIMKTYVV